MQTIIDYTFTQSNRPSISGQKTITHTGEVNQDFSIPNGSTNLDFTIASVASGRKGYWFKSDKDVTIKVNDSGAPDATIELEANVPHVSIVDAADSDITVDIDTLFFTNASGATATVQVRILNDAVEVP